MRCDPQTGSLKLPTTSSNTEQGLGECGTTPQQVVMCFTMYAGYALHSENTSPSERAEGASSRMKVADAMPPPVRVRAGPLPGIVRILLHPDSQNLT